MMAVVTSAGDQRLAAARAALRAGDSATARAELAACTAGDEEPSAEVLEGLAKADYLELDFPSAIARLERAYGRHHTDGNGAGSVRVARTLGYLHAAIRGDWAVGMGWVARAQRLLGDSPDSSEQGWVHVTTAMFRDDRAEKERRFRDAIAIARATGDVELELVALAYLGASLVHEDRNAEGMVMLDEALAAVAGHEVDDFWVLEEIFCQLFSACEFAHDVERADQWIRVGEGIAERRRLPAVSAFCRTHYGGVLTDAGRWPEADTALTEAVRLWGLGERSALRIGALSRLADLRLRQGRVEDALLLLEGFPWSEHHEATLPRAAVHLAYGEIGLAQDLLERGLDGIEPSASLAAPWMALLVDVLIAAGRFDDAAAVVARLDACAAAHADNVHLGSRAALARGRLGAASGTGDAIGCLRAAVAGFAKARAPMELARSRLELARVLADERPDVALAEARAAFETFGMLDAARDADAAAAVLRSLGVRTASPKRVDGQLTRREVEVLDLLGAGLSNPEIAERLFISRKTVEHHVGNILAKLGLRSRAEAAAHAARSGATTAPGAGRSRDGGRTESEK